MQGRSHSGKKLHRVQSFRMERDHAQGDTRESIQLRWRGHKVQREIPKFVQSQVVLYARSQGDIFGTGFSI